MEKHHSYHSWYLIHFHPTWLFRKPGQRPGCPTKIRIDKGIDSEPPLVKNPCFYSFHIMWHDISSSKKESLLNSNCLFVLILSSCFCPASNSHFLSHFLRSGWTDLSKVSGSLIFYSVNFKHKKNNNLIEIQVKINLVKGHYINRSYHSIDLSIVVVPFRFRGEWFSFSIHMK